MAVILQMTKLQVEYITKLGKKALEEQKDRMGKRKAFSLLDDLDVSDLETEPIKKPAKRKNQSVALSLLDDLGIK